MVTGRLKDYISVSDIMDRTTGGYDIYMYYLGEVKRLMKRPWGKDDKPSWGVFPKNGIWWWKDQATEESGNAIKFVEKYFSLTFKEAKEKICWDFQIEGGKEIVKSPVITWTPPSQEEKEYVHIAFSSKPFSKKHHNFWNIAGVSEPHCNKLEIWAVKDAAMNHRRVRILKDEIVFAYYAPEEDGVKLYFPEREKGERFRNNVSYNYLWNYENVKVICNDKCNKLLVQKSVKDLAVSTLFTPYVIGTQAEAIKIFNEETVGRINNLSDEVFIAYGSDPDGKKKSIAITKEQGYKWVNPPNRFLPEVNDFYSLAAAQGPESVEKLLKSKGVI